MILFKFLLFIFIFFFIIKKIGGFVLRVLFGAAAQQSQQQRTQSQRPADGNVHIDSGPKDKSKSTKDFKGGDYVDFEEVKD